jgi:hypothetical protein
MMPFGVDVLGTLSEKLKQLMNEAKDQHSSFTDLTKLYKEEKINEKDFFSKILNYVVTTSALTFLMARVILELRSALEKGTTIKDVTVRSSCMILILPQWSIICTGCIFEASYIIHFLLLCRN